MEIYDLFTTSATVPDNNTATYIGYDPVTYTDFAGGIPLCSLPSITSFTPAVKAGLGAAGGSGSLLTIGGSGFGSVKGTVELKDADVGGTQYLTLDDYDILSWSDTQIQIRVPGRVAAGSQSTPGNPIQGFCGSGSIKVNNFGGASAVSPSQLGDLDVEYGFLQILYVNTSSGAVEQKLRKFLAKNNCADGFTFRVDNALYNNAPAIKVIETALATWSVKTGIYLALEKDTQGAIVSQSVLSAQADGINAIFSIALSGNAAMQTNPHYLPCGTGSNLVLDNNDVDIAINPGTSWDYSLQGNVQGVSYLSAFLHELGHAIGLGHVVTPNQVVNLQRELMFYQSPTNPAEADRLSLTTGRAKAIPAAADVTTVSELQTWCDPNVQPLHSTGSSACRATKPLAPGLKAQVNAGASKTITLDWNTIYNATGYTIQSSTTPTTGFTNYASISNRATSSYTTSNLDPLTSYYFRIKATNVAGSSAYSNIASATTAARANPSPLSPPTGLQGAALSGSTVSNYLSWSYATTGSTFIVSRATNIEFQNATQFTTSIDVYDFTDTNITPGTVYFYRVRAVVSGTESDDTQPTSLTAAGCTPLGTVRPNSSFFMKIISTNSNQKSISYTFPVSGAISYTWNMNPPVEDAGGWVVTGSYPDGVSLDYVGTFPYTGPAVSIVVEIADNCGNTVVRSTNVGMPIQFGPPQARTLSDTSVTQVVSIYPNPAQRQLHIAMPNSWKTTQIRLIDLKTGNALKTWQTTATSVDTDLCGVPAGIYMLEATGQNQVQRLRLEVAP